MQSCFQTTTFAFQIIWLTCSQIICFDALFGLSTLSCKMLDYVYYFGSQEYFIVGCMLTKGKLDKPHCQSTTLELGPQFQPNTPIRQLQLHSESSPAGTTRKSLISDATTFWRH
jgi:hypothetical protein